jgi:hypothetical protein
MPDIIQSLWIGDSLSKVEQLSIKSFINNGHPYVLYTYTDIKNLPEGVTIGDANKIVPEKNIFAYKNGWGKGSYAGFADLFRFELLNKMGNWWVDTDVICLKPFKFDNELVICSSFEGKWGICPNSCIIKASAGHKMTTYILDYIYSIDYNNIEFGDIGPLLVQKTVNELGLEPYVVPYGYFNPISWSNVGDLVLDKISIKNRFKETLRPLLKPKTMDGRTIGKDAYAIHLWNEVWRQSGFGKNDTYASNSIFEKLKRKNGIS